MSKNNVPYYIAETLATLTLLASVVFAAAPYIGFLAPVAALSVGLPFIIGYVVFSVITIALSYKAISKNKTISEKDVQLAKEKDKVQAQEQTISGQNDQLAKKEAEVKAKEKENSELKSKMEAQEQENSKLKNQVRTQKQKNSKLENKVEVQEKENSKLKNQVRTQKQKNSEQKTQLAEKNKKIEEDKLKVAIADGAVQLAKGTVNSAVWFAKEAVNGVLYSGKYAYDNYVPSTESTKGTLSGIGGGLKNTYDASIASVRGALNSVGSSLYSRIYGTKVSSPEEQFKREDGSKPSMQELTRLDCDVSSQLAENEEDIFYDAESCDEKDTEVSSLKEQLDENSKAKVPSRISDLCESVKGKFNSVGNKLKNVYDTMPSTESVKGALGNIGNDMKSVYNTSVECTKVALNSVGSGLKNTYDTSIESAKGTISSVGNKLKNVYDTMPSTESARNWVPSLKTAGWIAGGTGLLVGTTYITVNGGLSIAGNSFNVAGNSTNGTESDASISNSSSVYYRPTYQQIKQIQIHEINKKLADANKWYEDNYGTPKEDSLSNKGIFSSICNKVSSVWSSLGNLISGSNESAHNCSEPQWCKDLHKSEDLEEIIDDGVLDNLFFPRVDNSINTSRQQGTLFDSADLEKLIQEPHPSAYPNGSPRIL